MTNGDSRHEERIRTQEEFAAMRAELDELIAEGREALERWARESAERQQTFEQWAMEVKRRQDASRTVLQKLLDINQDKDVGAEVGHDQRG